MNAYERVNERLDWIEKKLKELRDDQWAARNDASKAVSELCNRVEMLEPKDSVAPAPKRYRDVTAECSTSLDNDIIHEGCAMWLPYHPHNRGRYRLRKVPHDTIRVKRTDERPEDCFTPGSAFIIEKEES